MSILKQLRQKIDAKRTETKKLEPKKVILIHLGFCFVCGLIVLFISVFAPHRAGGAGALAFIAAAGYLMLFVEIYSGDIVVSRKKEVEQTTAETASSETNS
jgi:amino acid permease